MAIQPELSHVRRVGVSTITGSTLTMIADYIEVPVMWQLSSPALSGFAPFVSAGPAVAVRLRCRLFFQGGGVRTDANCDEARGATSRWVDVGVAVGGGAGWRIGGTRIAVEGRYTAGLLPNVLPTDGTGARSTAWSVQAGASVPLYRMRSVPPTRYPPLAAALPLAALVTPPGVPPAPAMPMLPEGRRVTFTVIDVDAGEIIAEIARAGGLNVVVSSGGRARVSLTLTDATAADAIRAVAGVAGLKVQPPSAPGGASIVFRDPAMNVNTARASAIGARFGVSGDLARWVVESRPPEPDRP